MALLDGGKSFLARGRKGGLSSCLIFCHCWPFRFHIWAIHMPLFPSPTDFGAYGPNFMKKGTFYPLFCQHPSFRSLFPVGPVEKKKPPTVYFGRLGRFFPCSIGMFGGFRTLRAPFGAQRGWFPIFRFHGWGPFSLWPKTLLANGCWRFFGVKIGAIPPRWLQKMSPRAILVPEHF